MRSLLMRSPVATAAAWIGSYLLICVSPLLVLALYPSPEWRGFWIEFSVALGFVGMAMMALQFVVAARVNSIETAYGVDIVLQFHRYMSLVAFALVLIHPLILFFSNTEYWELLYWPTAPWRARFAVMGTLALITLVVTSIWRKKLHLPYELWRNLHNFLAILAVGFGILHAIGVSYYLEFIWQGVLWGAISLCVLWLVFYSRVIKPWMMTRKAYTVEEVIPQRGDVWTLALKPTNHEGFTFEPGQFAWITVGISPFRMREHPFSMSSSGIQKQRIEFSIKALGDFTHTIKDIQPGTRAYLDGPYGVFTTERYQDSAGFVLVAGGIGITPMISMLATAAAAKDERPYLLIYASRSWDQITFREELEQLKDQIDLEVVHVLRDPPSEWMGESGYVDQKLLKKYIPTRRGIRHYFICAAPRMMDQVERSLHQLEVPITNIHMEHFNMV